MEGQISHYKVLDKLGGGGMGVVYKARDLKLNRYVALKFLPPELTRDNDARERFILEAQAASVLDHPNICTIYEVDEAPDGQMFIAMAYYEGQTLKKQIASGPLAPTEALNVAISVGQGLAEAHAAGIVHRDIKPANVMLTSSGLVKIVDFGIAKLLDVTGPTRTGTTLGTVSYMSPEQAAGEDADQQSDVWALGAVFYEMLTGQQPFRGESSLAVMNAVTTQTPAKPSTLRPNIPSDIERLVLRSLEKSREARYPSANRFLEAARACQTASTQPIPVTSPAGGMLRVLLAPKTAVPAATLAIAIGAWWAVEVTRETDARREAERLIPKIRELVAQNDHVEAFAH